MILTWYDNDMIMIWSWHDIIYQPSEYLESILISHLVLGTLPTPQHPCAHKLFPNSCTCSKNCSAWLLPGSAFVEHAHSLAVLLVLFYHHLQFVFRGRVLMAGTSVQLCSARVHWVLSHPSRHFNTSTLRSALSLLCPILINNRNKN